MERACKACGRTDTMVGRRLSAKFCDATCRKRWQRRNDKRVRFRMHNDLRTDTLEFYIALVRHRETSAETVLRQIADRIGAPIREDVINEEYEKLEESAKRRGEDLKRLKSLANSSTKGALS